MWDVLTPWPHIADAYRLAVAILDSGDPSLATPIHVRVDELLALRDPDGVYQDALARAGALADERLSETEAQHLLADELVGLGYPVSFIDLPDSTHMRLSDAALTILAGTLTSASAGPSAE